MHNGNLTNARQIRDELIKEGAIFQSYMDTENLIHLIARAKQENLIDRIKEAVLRLKGAFCFVILSRKKMFVIRDRYGFRPLSLGEIVNSDGSKGYVVASETCAFDLVGAKYLRDVEPGEMLIFSKMVWNRKVLCCQILILVSLNIFILRVLIAEYLDDLFMIFARIWARN